MDLSLNYKNGVQKNYVLFLNERADSISKMFKSTGNFTDKDKEDKTIWNEYNYSKSIKTRKFPHDQVQIEIAKDMENDGHDIPQPEDGDLPF